MHVLSTPPAFILSQDQTLMLKFNLSEFSLAKYPWQSFLIIFTVFKVASTFVLAVLKLKSLAYVLHKLFLRLLTDVSRSETRDKFSKKTYLGSFKVISLFSYQCSFWTLLVRLCCCQQLIQYIRYFIACQQLFIFFVMSYQTQLLYDNMCIISCQDFFQLPSAAFPKAFTVCLFSKVPPDACPLRGGFL